LLYPLFQLEAELLSLRTSHEFERRGGGGGGGCGGVSYGIYVHNYSVAPAAYRESNAFLGGGLGGAPGKGGPSLGADGSDGHTGVADDLNF